MRGSVRDVDKGWKQLVRELGKASGSKAHVVVGWPAKTGAVEHEGKTGATVAAVAAFNEYGTEHIPARSMIGATVDENKEKYRSAQRAIAHGMVFKRIELKQGLDVLGVMVKGDIQRRINAGVPPPNAPRTVERKGSSKPLVDSGQMKGAIDHEVRDA